MRVPIHRAVLATVAALTAAAPLRAQQPAPTAEQLKSWITVRQQRVDLLRDEIKQIDSRLESRLDAIIDTLKMIADSKDSRTKVARMKENTGKRLMQTIRYYEQKRATLKEELRQPRLRLTEAEKRKLIAVFDARIEKRTQQILALNQSMPTHEEHERYRVTSDDDDRRRSDADYQRNDDFQQNRRITTHTNSQRDAIVKQLDSSIARLDRQARSLKTQLASTAEPLQKKTLAEEIAKTEALIAERRRQRLETLTAAGGSGRAVGLKEATDLDKALETAISDLRREFTVLFERYNTYLNELSNLHVTEAALAAKSTR